MDEDDIPLEQLRKTSSLIFNDQMLTPFDPAIEFQFDANEIFNFGLSDLGLYTFYEKSLSLDDHPNTDATTHAESNADENKTQSKDLIDEKPPMISVVDESKDPLNTSETTSRKRPIEETPSACKKPKDSVDPGTTSTQTKEASKNVYIIQCGHCFFHTVSLHDLRVHMRGHRDMNGKKYKCYYCDFLTTRSYYLRQHGAYMHGSAYNCQLCAFKTYSNSKMMSHMRHIH